MDWRAEHIEQRARHRAIKKSKHTIFAAGEIRKSNPLTGDSRTYHSCSIDQVGLASVVNNSDRPSGLKIAPEKAEMREVPESSAVCTPGITNNTGESSSTDKSVISNSEEHSCHGEASETNSNSPIGQSHKADHAQSDDKKRKRLTIDDEDGNPAQKKQASQHVDASNSDTEAGRSYTTPDKDTKLESPVAAKATLSRKELLQFERFNMVSKLLDETIAKKEGHRMLLADIVKCREMIEVMKAKYQKKEESTKWKPRPKACKHPTTKDEFMVRLEGKEEKEHPWTGNPDDPNIPALLMRGWDEMSQCQIKDARIGFLSGSPSGMLETRKQRELALKQHSDWGNRSKTAFISTSSSLEEIAQERIPWFQNRQRKKGIEDNTRLTLINSRVRLAEGKPVLSMNKELLHYDVRTKYGDPRAWKDSFYEHEYLLPYSCGPEEIVGTWPWYDIEEWIKTEKSDFEGWYNQVGLVAFKKHEKARLLGETLVCTSGCKCCGK